MPASEQTAKVDGPVADDVELEELEDVAEDELDEDEDDEEGGEENGKQKRKREKFGGDYGIVAASLEDLNKQSLTQIFEDKTTETDEDGAEVTKTKTRTEAVGADAFGSEADQFKAFEIRNPIVKEKDSEGNLKVVSPKKVIGYVWAKNGTTAQGLYLKSLNVKIGQYGAKRGRAKGFDPVGDDNARNLATMFTMAWANGAGDKNSVRVMLDALPQYSYVILGVDPPKLMDEAVALHSEALAKLG